MATNKIPDSDRKAAENLEIRSDEIRDILGQVPRWILRYGTLLIALIFILLITGAALLRFPDVIHARVKLTTEVPPADIVANTSGRIQRIFIKDKSEVEKNQVLAIIESSVDYKNLEYLNKIGGTTFSVDTLMAVSFPDNLRLGMIQESYASMLKSIQEYQSFLGLDYHRRKINSINTELKRYTVYLSRLKEQEKVQGIEYSLAVKQFQRDSILYLQQVMSSSQLEKSETQKLNKLFEWKETQTNLASAEIEVSNLHQEILELELKFEENQRNYIQSLREAYEKLKGQIDIWENTYTLKSPFKGMVSFTRIWSENQYIDKGQVVMTVIPEIQGDILGKIELSAKGAGKIKEGHRVIIQFDNYPYMEFGTVEGSIKSISLVPNDELYTAEIRLDSSELITNYNQHLEFQHNMPGFAEVVTDERSILERIVAPFKSAFKKQQNFK
jgi:HlyD family secretion protein